MNKRKVITVFITSGMVTFAIAATTLSPNQNNQSGIIPTGYDDLIFSVSNGNWVKNISLPNVAKEGALITIQSTAGYDSDIDLSNVNIEKKGVLTLKSGNSYRFKFSNGKWEFYAPETANFTPEKNGNTIPVFQQSQAQYVLSDAAWTEIIHLPQTGQNGQILVVKSNALKSSKINSQNALFPSTLVVNKNDAYIFQYNQELSKWVPLSVPTRIINVINGNTAALNTALQNLTAAKTEIRFADGAWVSSLKLPQTANDRDRIIVSSTASWQSVIENENTNTTATLKLNKGNRYEFIYIADKSYWVLASSPKTVFTANTAAQGFTFKTPVVEITADNAQWAPVVNLPTAQSGDKVILSNSADTAFTVSGSNISASLKKGDKIRLVFNNGVWNTDSYQIDLLLVNSPVVNDKLGATAAKIQAREALRLTNEALENSQAKAYYKEVGYLDYRIPGTTLVMRLI